MKRITEASSSQNDVPSRLIHTDQLWRFTPRGTRRTMIEALHMWDATVGQTAYHVHARGERTHEFILVRTRDTSRNGARRGVNWPANYLPVRELLAPGDTLELTPDEAFGQNPDYIQVYYWELEQGEAPPARLVEGLPGPSAPTAPAVNHSPLDDRHTAFVAQAPQLNDAGELADEITPFPPGADQQESGFVATRLETQLQEGIYYGRLPALARQVALRLQRSLAHVVGAGEHQSHLVRATERGELATTDAARDIEGHSFNTDAPATDTFVFTRAATRVHITASTQVWNIQWLNEHRYNRGDDVTLQPQIKVPWGQTLTLHQEVKVIRLLPFDATLNDPARIRVLGEH